jgi:hypothetical protein
MAAELEVYAVVGKCLRLGNLAATFRECDPRSSLHQQLRRRDAASRRTNDDDVLPHNRESQSRSLWDGLKAVPYNSN